MPKGIKCSNFPNEGYAGLWRLFIEWMFATVFNRNHITHSCRISSDEEEKRMTQPKRFDSGEVGWRRVAAGVFKRFNVQKGKCVFGLGGSASPKCPDWCLELFKDLHKPSFLFKLWVFKVQSDWMDKKGQLISFPLGSPASFCTFLNGFYFRCNIKHFYMYRQKRSLWFLATVKPICTFIVIHMCPNRHKIKSLCAVSTDGAGHCFRFIILIKKGRVFLSEGEEDGAAVL